MNSIIVKNDSPLTPPVDTDCPFVSRPGPSALVLVIVGEGADAGVEKTAGTNTSAKPQRIPRANRNAIRVLVTVQPSISFPSFSLLHDYTVHVSNNPTG